MSCGCGRLVKKKTNWVTYYGVVLILVGFVLILR